MGAPPLGLSSFVNLYAVPDRSYLLLGSLGSTLGKMVGKWPGSDVTYWYAILNWQWLAFAGGNDLFTHTPTVPFIHPIPSPTTYQPAHPTYLSPLHQFSHCPKMDVLIDTNSRPPHGEMGEERPFLFVQDIRTPHSITHHPSIQTRLIYLLTLIIAPPALRDLTAMD